MSEVTARQQCPECMDTGKDNLVTYKDGKHCHGCGYTEKNKIGRMSNLIAGTVVELVERGLLLQTCEHYNVRVKECTGRVGHLECNKELLTIYPIYKNGKVVKQKIRSHADKSRQTQVGDTKCYNMFGQHAFNPTKKLPVVICEGEYDAMCMYQCTGLPSISITRGATGARKELTENLEWLSQWREVLLCFDMDDAGREAAKECAGIFEPGTVKNIRLPLKDANEMVLEGRSSEIKKCINTAESIKPSTIVSLMDILDEIITPPKFGTSWPWNFMTKITYGCRMGETYMFAGPESVGKTQFMYEIVANYLMQGCRVGFFDLERDNAQTAQRFIGNMHSKLLHRPNSPDWDADLLKAEAERLNDCIKLYRPESGKLTLESILINIRYMSKCFGITLFILDNLTKLNVNLPPGMTASEFASIATGQICQIDTELKVTTLILNHPTKAPVQLNADITMGDDYVYQTNKEGLTWETGRMMESHQVYGGGNVVKLPDYVFLFARNRMSSDDVIKRTLLIKAVKTRFESEFEGHVQKLLFDRESGKYKEVY